jgi:hypothetical protein
MVPSMLLQPLVENAASASTRPEGGTIRIDARVEGRLLHISVRTWRGRYRRRSRQWRGLGALRERWQGSIREPRWTWCGLVLGWAAHVRFPRGPAPAQMVGQIDDEEMARRKLRAPSAMQCG